MRRLVQLLNLKLQEPDISVEALSSTTRLLLQLDGNEEAILKDYLLRRRRSLLDALNNFPPPPVIRESHEEVCPSDAPDSWPVDLRLS